jgi:hypothetical protein
MKLPPLVILFAASGLLAGCGSLDNPFAGMNWFGTGKDARVYNAQTGQFEWPKEDQAHARKPANAGAAPVQVRKTDGRYYDATKNQWVDTPDETARPSRPKPRATPTVISPGSQVQTGPAPEPPPAQASGVYNSSTGRIEWGTYRPAPASTPAPRKKSWWWPF